MNRPARLEKYSEEFVRIATSMYDSWSTQPSVPLFISGSDLLLHANMTALYGRAFVDRHATELIPIVRSFERAFVHPLTRVLPLWASPSGRVLLRAYKRLKEVIEAEVRMRLRQLDKWRDEPDYMSYLLTMDDKAEDFFACYGEHLVGMPQGGSLTVAWAKSLSTPSRQMIMISASHVNTAATFSWTVLHLLRNPHLLAQFEDEIRRNRPNDGVYPTKHMPFSEACMRETGRLYTNLLLVRYATHDLMTPDGKVVPKGWVAASPLATQQDPTLYTRPKEWDPARFLSPDDYSSKFRHNEFVQFGYGKHVCLGEKLTHSLLRASLWPALFDGYQVEIVDGVVEGEGVDGVGVKPNFGQNLGTPFGIREVRVRVRKKAVKLTESESARDRGSPVP
jgi:sterol 14-demethylase